MGDDEILVILCCYQGERFISKQIDSILSQSYQNLKLHIFDDASTDDTQQIVKRFEQHNNVFLHINHINKGFVKNFEFALAKIDAAYIALSDQDDIWHVDKLKQSYQALRTLEQENQNAPCLVHSDLCMIDQNGKCLSPSFFNYKQISLPKKKSLAKILGYNGVMGNTILMNRQLAQLALPFPDSLKYHDYWLALVNETFGARKTLNAKLVSYRIHNKNASENRSTHQVQHIPPPFTEDNRKETLAYFLSHYDINKEDKIIISGFYNYLNPDNNKISRALSLLKYGFLRNDWRYKLRVLWRLLVKS